MIIYRVTCTHCGLAPDFFVREGMLYIVDANGKRVPCRHPLEQKTIREVLGNDISTDDAVARIGREHPWLCASCLSVTDLDPKNDELCCSQCGSKIGRLFSDLHGWECPACGKGTVVVSETGLVA